ncbi:glutathione-disulfide reductase [Maritalea mediterranea]|uniref:Glutathione reductase n=1 Tax=Maritalea mediterranea TaxID=2909667 RepID=A0ABS9E5E3_9HYPH|nr:glutathione-disulfide reductase [Maritalea mediterranea]MCF4098027.1 glutathione-disulfide reductase [Maritalea mediterranea]
MGRHFDLIVIGAGSGGVRAGRLASTYGAKVAVIEEYRLGGTCVIRGCVPKKLFVYASRFADQFEMSKSFGWTIENAEFNWQTLRDNKDKEIKRLEGIYGNILDNAGVTTIRDRAELTSGTSVKLKKSGEELTADRILIATGGTPFVPSIPGAELGITSNEAFHLEKLPEKMLIVGGGYIAVEFAGIFAGMGVKVSLAYRGPQILRGFDQDVRDMVAEQMQARGVDILTNTDLEALEKSGDDIKVKFNTGKSQSYGEVMFATGRTPSTKGLGLEYADVECGAREEIIVDEQSRTSCKTVFAVGDVTDRAALTPVAIREGAAFAETFYNDNPTFVHHDLIPTAVFSEPEVGTIGLTEAEASNKYHKVNVYKATFRPMMSTLSDKPEKEMYKLITDADTDKVLGVHIVGHAAGEIIQTTGIAVTMGATKADFDRTIAVHPTAAEELVTMKQPSYVLEYGKKVD